MTSDDGAAESNCGSGHVVEDERAISQPLAVEGPVIGNGDCC
jgi:hypothetical protein